MSILDNYCSFGKILFDETSKSNQTWIFYSWDGDKEVTNEDIAFPDLTGFTQI